MERTAAGVTTRVRVALNRFDPAIVRLVTAARRIIRLDFPGAVELVYDNYNALVFGYGPSERAGEAAFSIAAYPRWVNLFFLQGAQLPDPSALLRGTGRRVRGMRLASAEAITAPAVKQLLQAAIERLPKPFPAGRGRSVIRASAVVRRPRRPSRAARTRRP